MSEELFLDGLLRVRIDVGTKKRPRREFFYLINLDELTTAVVEGVPSLNNPEHEKKDFWTDFDLAQLVMNLSPATVDKMSEDEKDRHRRNALDLLGTEINKKVWKHARGNGGWHSRMIQAEGHKDLGHTVLQVRENDIRSKPLKQRYETLLGNRKYKAIHENTYFFSQLAEFDKKFLRPLQRRQAELDKDLAVVRHVTSRVSNAHMGLVAMFHCAESPQERKQRWGTRPPIEPDNSMYGKRLAPRAPTGEEIDNAKRVRDRFLPALYKDLNGLMAWMASGTKKNGKAFTSAQIRNTLAEKLLAALRENEEILSILENHLNVNRFLWRRVESLLLECFHHLLLAPNTRDALMAGELGQLAQHVAGPVPAMEMLTASTKRSREVKEAMSRFVAENDFPSKPTRLSRAVLALKSHADPVLDHRSTITKLWALATPTLLESIEHAARKAGDQNPSAVAASWGWRSSFGIIELEEDAQKEVWERAVKFTENPTKAQADNIFASKGLQIENRFWNSQAAWSAYETTIAIIAATDAMLEHADDPTPDTAIAAWTAALEAVKAVPDFAATISETQMFIRMSAGPGKSLISKIASFADSVPFKYVDGIIALLKFEATSRATKAVFESKTASAEDKDIAREKAQLGYVSLLVSAAGTVIGSPLVLAGTVLYLGTAVILNRDVWDACLTSIEGLPGPGRAVKLVWTEYTDGFRGARPLEALIKGSPWADIIATSIEPLKNVTSDTHRVGAGSFWPLSSGDPIMSPRTAGMLRRQYGVHLELAKELAAY